MLLTNYSKIKLLLKEEEEESSGKNVKETLR
jgi:hypothetical protein